MNTTTFTRSYWPAAFLVLVMILSAGGALALARYVLAEPEPDPQGIVQSADAFSLAHKVDEANTLSVRQELAIAIEDGKLTFAEHQRVSTLAADAINARNIAEAMSALDIAAKGYSE